MKFDNLSFSATHALYRAHTLGIRLLGLTSAPYNPEFVELASDEIIETSISFSINARKFKEEVPNRNAKWNTITDSLFKPVLPHENEIQDLHTALNRVIHGQDIISEFGDLPREFWNIDNGKGAKAKGFYYLSLHTDRQPERCYINVFGMVQAFMTTAPPTLFSQNH